MSSLVFVLFVSFVVKSAAESLRPFASRAKLKNVANPPPSSSAATRGRKAVGCALCVFCGNIIRFPFHCSRAKKPLSSNFLHRLMSAMSSGLRSAALGLMPCWAINFSTEAMPARLGQGLRGMFSAMAR